MSRDETSTRYWLVILALIAFVHSAIYAIANPVFESPDEPYHLEYINYVARTYSLPVQAAGQRPVQHAHQFPLYYVLSSPIPIALGQVEVRLQAITPEMGWPHFLQDRDPFPDNSSRIGFYLLRLLNSLIVALAVLQIGRSSRRIVQGMSALVAPGLAAFLPQLAFIGGSVSNDPLTLLLFATATLWAIRAFKDESNWFRPGFWIGAATLTKKSALALLPGLLVLPLLQRNSNKSRSLLLLLAGASFLILPLISRNIAVYGDPLLNRVEIQTLPELVFPQPLNSDHFLVHMPEELPRSFIAHFGWMAVRQPDIVVRPWEFCLAVLLVASFFSRQRRLTLFLWVLAISNFVALMYYNLTFPQMQGRLLFPALPAFMLLCSLGAHVIFPRLKLRRRYLVAAPVTLYLFLAAWTAFDVNNIFYERTLELLKRGVRDDVPVTR